MKFKQYIFRATFFILITAFATSSSYGYNSNGRDDRHHEFNGHHRMLHKGHQMNGKRGHSDHAMMLIRHSDELELTNEQEIQLLKLSQSHRDEMKTHREALKDIHQQMKMLREQKEFDEEKIRELAGEMHPLMTEGMVMKGKYKSQIAEILTDEQLQKIEDLRKQKSKKKGRVENRENRRGKFENRSYREQANLE